MPDVGALVLFAGTAAVIISIPGPSVIFLVSRALSGDRRGALMSVLGNSFGEYIQVIGVAFGLGAVIEDSAFAFNALKLLGGVYLVYLGIKTFRQRKSLGEAIGALSQPSSGLRAFAEAMTVGATNPKTIIFMAAILPQFVSRSSAAVAPQILVLGAIFAAIAVISDSIWVLLAGRFRDWFARSPQRLELVGGTGGLAIGAVGVSLLVTGRKS